MPRNIVLLCDGTSNEVARNRTNILRLYGTLEKSARQLVFYDPGVGTFGDENAWLHHCRRLKELWGLLTGWGIDVNVKQAYRFLVDHYDPGDGQSVAPDRIYIVGFSRGAYTARMLAGFINALGLIERRNLNLLDYAYRAYKTIDDTEGLDISDAPAGRRDAFAELRLFSRMLNPARPAIRCLALFDTVGSVIELDGLWPRIRTHPHTSRNPSVAAVRHAVALDERRSMYMPSLWPEDQPDWGGPFPPEPPDTPDTPDTPGAARPQDAREVWFSGVHGDIGGGYPEKASALAKIPLRWMIDETQALGLHYDAEAVRRLVDGTGSDGRYVGPDPLARPNPAFNVLWRMVEFLPRLRTRASLTRRAGLLGVYLPLFERRHVPAHARVHASVFARRGTAQDYAQPNIPADHRIEGTSPNAGLR
ncbi:MAG: DUF2235 domain-containing protein [Pseudomonadota bacterium]